MHWNNLWSSLLVASTVFGGVLAKPVPVDDKPVLRRLPSHSHLGKRNIIHLSKRWTKEDAGHWEKVLQWMKDTKQPSSPLVFYSGAGDKDAEKFIEANRNYGYFWDLFTPEEFEKDFGIDLDNMPQNEIDPIMKACSEAMGKYATGETRVFGDKDSKEGSYWRTYEKPFLMSRSEVTKIWSMNAGTTDPNKHDAGDLKAGGSGTPAPKPTKALQIIWQESADEISGVMHHWNFFMGSPGTGVDPCKANSINKPQEYEAPGGDKPPQTINGEWKLKLDGKDCTFQGTGEGPAEGGPGQIGWLHCSNMNSVKCYADAGSGNCASGSTAAHFERVGHCDF